MADSENRSFENSSYFQDGYLNVLSQADEMLSSLKSDYPVVAFAAADACKVMAQEVCLSTSNLRFKAGMYLLGTEKKECLRGYEISIYFHRHNISSAFRKTNSILGRRRGIFQVASKACSDISASHKETFEDRQYAANLPYTKFGVAGLEETF